VAKRHPAPAAGRVPANARRARVRIGQRWVTDRAGQGAPRQGAGQRRRAIGPAPADRDQIERNVGRAGRFGARWRGTFPPRHRWPAGRRAAPITHRSRIAR
jgi:hypothetical protein